MVRFRNAKPRVRRQHSDAGQGQSVAAAVAAAVAAKIHRELTLLSDRLSGRPVVEEGGKRPESCSGGSDQARARPGEQQVDEGGKEQGRRRVL